MTNRILILGGTAEARRLAGALAQRPGVETTLSLAGRTAQPLPQPVPVRVGGFGGALGLGEYLRQHRIGMVLDATHPHAARISANAAEAAAACAVPILALRRPAWDQVEGDRWTRVSNVAEAVSALGQAPRRIFVALGRQELGPFVDAPQHAYVVRSVDAIDPPMAVPQAEYILDRGPFEEDAERRLLETLRIDALVCKNSGGSATYGKIAAARALGIDVILIDRPDLPAVPAVDTVEAMVEAVDHWLEAGSDRGV
jgi:precorrin-6A/cobalt-precorrin-6A reductase